MRLDMDDASPPQPWKGKRTMQTLIVILIVAIAALYVGRVFYRRMVQQKRCACGCSGCDITDACSPPPADGANPVDPSNHRT
jgi:hypothetical protein